MNLYSILSSPYVVTLSNPLLDFLLKIVCCFVFGALLGIERRRRQQFVGMRTLILICTSSCLLMELSIYVSRVNGGDADPGRIAAQVVSGIGFIGAGTILKQGLNIKGLTSAAIIWTAAALGLAVGAGLLYFALITLIFGILALVIIEKIEDKMFPAVVTKKLRLSFHDSNVDFNEITKILKKEGFIVTNMDFSENIDSDKTEVMYIVRVPKNSNLNKVIPKIKKVGKLKEVRFIIK